MSSMTRSVLILILLFLISCSTRQPLTAAIQEPATPTALAPGGASSALILNGNEVNKDRPPVSSVPTTKLSEWTCDVLVAKANDETFSLKGLAGLTAKKKCPNFTMDVKKLSDFEKKIYSEEIAELDPTSPAPAASLSIEELKKNLKLAEIASEKLKAYKQLRAKQKSSGQRNDFLKTTADMFNWTKAELRKNKSLESRNYFNEAAQLFARTYWTEDKVKKADEVLFDALRQLKGSISVAEIYFLQARMAEEKLELSKAVSLYDLAAEDFKQYRPKAASFTLDKILWLKSWILYKEKKWSDAEKSLQALANQTTDLSEKSRALFYRARALTKLDHKEDSIRLLEKIIKDDFFGYYGLVTYYELGRKLPALSKIPVEKKFPFDLELNFLKPHERKIFQDLVKYQEIDIAEKAVGILSRSPENQLNLGLYLADKGNRYLPLFAAFGKLNNDSRIEVLLTYSQLVYPQPHLAQVKSMSEQTSIPVSLIYSIMKQESAFNERTKSHADAWGLMQMIPRLAKQISKKFDIPYQSPDDLFKPEINIQLGAFELMEQVKKQEGQLTYVAAAYNAGPSALNGWLRSRPRTDMLEFIEEIPYDETRTYVKLIARNKLFYERISKRDEEQPFPSEFLELHGSKKDSSAKN